MGFHDLHQMLPYLRANSLEATVVVIGADGRPVIGGPLTEMTVLLLPCSHRCLSRTYALSRSIGGWMPGQSHLKGAFQL